VNWFTIRCTNELASAVIVGSRIGEYKKSGGGTTILGRAEAGRAPSVFREYGKILLPHSAQFTLFTSSLERRLRLGLGAGAAQRSGAVDAVAAMGELAHDEPTG
jgi:hypothetical protein